jgi:integrase
MGGGVGRLSARQVATAKLPAGQRKDTLCDGGNLYLEIVQGKSGLIKSWMFQYQLHHTRHWLGLGATHTVSLSEAREKARLLRQQLIEGVDPLEAKRARTRAAIAEKAKAITFEECAASYVRLHGDGWKPTHRHQWESTLRRYVHPRLGKLAPADIDSALVMKVIEPHWKTTTVTASRVLDRVAMIWDYAKTSGYCSGDNPARHVRSALPKQAKITSVEHHAALPYDDLPAFMARLRVVDSITARALEMVVLSGSRTAEVRLATWSEIDWAGKKWNRPASHLKAGEAHTVPLTGRMLEILRGLYADNIDPEARIFDVGERAIGRLVDRIKPEGVAVVPHGFRSTFRQWCAERTNFPDHVAEASLAHKVSDAVIKAYKRRAEPFEKRARLMAEWTRFCSTSAPAITGKVVSIR